MIFEISQADMTYMIPKASQVVVVVSPKANNFVASKGEVILCLKTNMASIGPPQMTLIRPPTDSIGFMPINT